uniref:NADH dehydrogenase subunit 4L n=1 Tax=Thaparocleidus asoti TaxID=341077 RepID=A0A7L8ZQU7_9PLAT|nr:NADH dehydrogenase subunit 4L [Thaparocleidus asoti]QOI72774.1 NADH dehydrogenase subunit 4L [Thaparocleidus asoti]
MFNLFYLISLLILLGLFCSLSFKFIGVLVLLENFNVLLLFYIFLNNFNSVSALFLIFMVIITIEVTLFLVSLTRVWDCDSLLY